MNNHAKQIRVFLADDHLMVREGIRSLLANASDIDVVGEASDGEEAVNKVRQLMPDLVLMDITMPVVNGLDATARIKEFAPQIKVLILTMHETDQYLSQMLHVGASGYVVKTGSSNELVSAIRSVYSGDVYLYPSIARMLVQDYLKNVGARQESWPEKLTSREVEILKYIAEDRKNKEIANLLKISIRTVQAHRTSIMEKIGAHDRTELVKYAIRKGLVSP